MNTICAFKRICRLFKDYVKRKKAKKNALTRHQSVLLLVWYQRKQPYFPWYHISNNATTKFVEI